MAIYDNLGVSGLNKKIEEMLGQLNTVTGDKGSGSVRNIPHGGSQTTTIVFDKPFRSKPEITATIKDAYPDGDGSYYSLKSYCTLTVTNVTTTSFTVKGTLNKSGYLARIDFDWVGICE